MEFLCLCSTHIILCMCILILITHAISSRYSWNNTLRYYHNSRFPNFDFSEVEHDDDVFYSDDRESDEHCCERAVKFLEWLNSRPEKCIAVVTHSSFLRHLFGQFGESLHTDDRDDLQRLAGNCELRSIVLCSHGNKDGKAIDPLRPPPAAPSTVRMGTIMGSEGIAPLNMDD